MEQREGFRTDHGRATSDGKRLARLRRAAGEASSDARRADLEEFGGGYERPKVMPADPAMVAEKNYEKQFVRQQRTRKVSWFNIAKMTGRTAPYLQALYGEGMP